MKNSSLKYIYLTAHYAKTKHASLQYRKIEWDIYECVFWFIWQDYITSYGKKIQKIDEEKCYLVSIIMFPLKYNNRRNNK
jgi:hypothetical protein